MHNMGDPKVNNAFMKRRKDLEKYADCQCRALDRGILNFILSSSFLYLIQRALKKRLPYSQKWNVPLSMMISMLFSHSVIHWEIKNCTDLLLPILETGHSSEFTSLKDERPSLTTSADAKVTKYGDAME